MKPRVNLITLGVENMARAIAFYRDGLKLPRYEFQSEEIAFFALNGTWLALFPRIALAADALQSAEITGFRGFSLAHNVGSELEVDTVIAEAIAAGATLIKPAQKTTWGGYSGYFSDPDGFLWEVAHVPQFWIGPRDE